jgi:metallo-beta-lactamase family protein
MRIVPFGAAREVTGSCHLRASVHTLGGFSGHAGQDELLSWLEGQRRVVLVHGEEEKLLELGKLLALRGQEVSLATWGEGIPV